MDPKQQKHIQSGDGPLSDKLRLLHLMNSQSSLKFSVFDDFLTIYICYVLNMIVTCLT